MLVGYVLLSPMCGVLMYLTVAIQLALGVWFFADEPSLDAAMPLSLAVTFFAAPIATIAAVPAVASLIRRGYLRLRNLLIMGAGLGTLPIVILMTLIILEKIRNDTLSAVPLGAIGGPLLMGAWFGAWGALFFWFVSIRGTELDHRSSK